MCLSEYKIGGVVFFYYTSFLASFFVVFPVFSHKCTSKNKGSDSERLKCRFVRKVTDTVSTQECWGRGIINKGMKENVKQTAKITK